MFFPNRIMLCFRSDCCAPPPKMPAFAGMTDERCVRLSRSRCSCRRLATLLNHLRSTGRAYPSPSCPTPAPSWQKQLCSFASSALPFPIAPMRPGRRGNLHALVMRDMDELSEVPRHAIRQRARHPIGKRATRHWIIKEKTGLTRAEHPGAGNSGTRQFIAKIMFRTCG